MLRLGLDAKMELYPGGLVGLESVSFSGPKRGMGTLGFMMAFADSLTGSIQLPDEGMKEPEPPGKILGHPSNLPNHVWVFVMNELAQETE